MRRLAFVTLLAWGLACGLGCDAILGLNQFTFDGSADDGAVDAGDECVGPNGCWACTPTTTEQYLNQCTGSCITFDSTRLTPFLLPDGALPPLPMPDGGTEASTDAAPADGGEAG